jgi:RNA polymerase sigma factor (TIGR02999 family)
VPTRQISRQITSLLKAWSKGDEAARDRLAGLVYGDLRRVAGSRLRGRTSPTFSPSDVVHDAFVRLLGQEARFANRAHFFAVAAEMMHRVLVDHARARQARKRGGGALRVDLSDVDAAQGQKDVDMIDLDHALAELAEQDPEQARVVQMRYFSGRTFEEIAEALGISPSAAKRSWGSARLWLNWRLRPRARRSAAES